MKKLVNALAVSVLMLGSFGFNNSANAGSVGIDVGPLPEQSCYGSQTLGRIDCVFPPQANTSYVRLDKVIWKSGSGFDVFFCNAKAVYAAPSWSGSTRDGCQKKVVGGNSDQSKVATNPYGNGWYDYTDIYINVHNNYQTSRFDVCTSACANP